MLDYCIRLIEEVSAKRHDDFKEVAPLEWGLDCLDESHENSDAASILHECVQHQITNSDLFFTPKPTSDYSFVNDVLKFPSAIKTETPENNVVSCPLFETGSRDRIVIIVPYWNAAARSFDKLGSLLHSLWGTKPTDKFALSRRTSDSNSIIADYMVSSNIGRTIRSCRQAVLDTRLAIDWLVSRGYRRIGLVGASLGSSICGLICTHDTRVNAVVMNLMADDWRRCGRVARPRHIREGFGEKINLATLNEAWKIISPITFLSKLQDRNVHHLIISGEY